MWATGEHRPAPLVRGIIRTTCREARHKALSLATGGVAQCLRVRAKGEGSPDVSGRSGSPQCVHSQLQLTLSSDGKHRSMGFRNCHRRFLTRLVRMPYPATPADPHFFSRQLQLELKATNVGMTGVMPGYLRALECWQGLPKFPSMASLSHRQGWSFPLILLLFPFLLLGVCKAEDPQVTYRTGTSEVRVSFFATDQNGRLLEKV